MTTYRTIADSEVEANAPVTEALVTALRDNVAATAEGATGAPKIASLALQPTTAVGDGATVTFSGLGSYGGAMIWANFRATSGDDGTIEFSDDGTTFYGSTVVATLSGTDRGSATISVDFSTRRLRAAVLTDQGATQSVNTLVTGLTVACTHIRLGGSTDVSGLIMPLGAVS